MKIILKIFAVLLQDNMVRILVTFLVINIVRSYNIEHNFPTFLQPDTQLGVNGENSGYFGYNLQIDSGPNNALK